MGEFNLIWGESVAVRQAFVETISCRPVCFGTGDLMEMGYPKHEGNAELVELTKQVIKRQTGLDFEHVFLTNGAAGAVTISMRAYAQRGAKTAFTSAPPYFPVYPSMIRAAGLVHKVEEELYSDDENPVCLVDSPSNPEGLVLDALTNKFVLPVIWDAVYHNKVYLPFIVNPIVTDVMCGSYSKLLGVNGIRVGWIATNDYLLSVRLTDLVTAEYCGLSAASTDLLLTHLKDFNWDAFELSARFKLDANREEWSKLERYFQGEEVGGVGMFYYAQVDEACKKLLDKAGVRYMPGSRCGTSDQYGRFNLGQDPQLIRNAVKEVMLKDKV